MDICPTSTVGVPVRILVRKPCNGYYIRWWYNGWHYWYFIPGDFQYETTGQKYRTLGKQKVEISSGVVELGKIRGLKTIMFTREVYLLRDSGWASVYIYPAENIVVKNHINGYELILQMTVGAGSVKANVNLTPSDYFTPSLSFQADVSSIAFLAGAAGVDYAQSFNVLAPGKDFQVTLYYMEWAVVINSYTKLTVYPLDINTGAMKEGYIKLTYPGYSDIWLWVVQFGGATTQIFEADKSQMTFGWDEYGSGFENYVYFNIVPDKTISQINTISSWASVTINQTTNYCWIYPLGKNDSTQRSGTITFSIDGGSDIIVTVYQNAIPVPGVPVALAGKDVLTTSFTANWQSESYSSGYYLDVAEDAAFTIPVAGFNNLDVGAVLSRSVTGLTGATDYWYRIRGYNDSGTGPNSNSIKVTTDIPFTVSVLPATLDFEWGMAPCLGDTTTVTSSHAWTAAWISGGADFEADKYAGTNGEVVTISCKAVNHGAIPLLGTLRFTCGTETADLDVTQNDIGTPC